MQAQGQAAPSEQMRERNDLIAKVNRFWNDMEEKYRGDLGAVMDDDLHVVGAMEQRITELEKRIAGGQRNQEARDASRARLAASYAPAAGGGLVHPSIGTGVGTAPPSAAQHRRTMQSLADQFLGHPDWQRYLNEIAPLGQVSENQSVRSPKIVFPHSFLNLVTGTSDTSAGVFVTPDDTGIFDPLGRRPLVLRDIISVRTTDSDLVEYVRQTSRTNNAAMVAEATAASGSSGVKPESDLALERISAPVRTIANWTAVTRRALSDAGQMRGIINQELRDNLEEELEDQILNGDGTGENFTGLEATSGTQDQAFDTDLLVTTRKARTLVRLNGRANPTAYVMNPLDWQNIDLLTDNEARYYFGGPSVLGTPRLWGLPVVECEAQPVDNAWVGDFRLAVLWDRQQTLMLISDSHSDFLIRNLLAILVESRHAFGVIRPAAFVEIDLTAGA